MVARFPCANRLSTLDLHPLAGSLLFLRMVASRSATCSVPPASREATARLTGRQPSHCCRVCAARPPLQQQLQLPLLQNQLGPLPLDARAPLGPRSLSLAQPAPRAPDPSRSSSPRGSLTAACSRQHTGYIGSSLLAGPHPSTGRGRRISAAPHAPASLSAIQQPRGLGSMDGMLRKFPGRIQEARRPGGLSCSRPSPGAVPSGGAVRTPQRAQSASGEEASAPAAAQAPPAWMGLVLPAVTKNVAVAVSALASNDIIALPTDTLYGIAGGARSTVAVERIYGAKGRDPQKPLPICVADPSDVAQYANVDHLPPGLLEALLPGPVTLVLPYAACGGLAPAALSGLATVGIRVPDATFVRAVARDFGGPLALTSANESSGLSSVSVEEFRGLWDKCACVFDAGKLSAGRREGSTIVELLPSAKADGGASCTFRIIRRGSAEEATRAHLKSFNVVDLAC